MLLASLLLLFAGHLVRTFRWRLLSAPFIKARLSAYFLPLAAGYAANLVLPFRLGEIIRTLLVSRLAKLPFGQALSTVVLDRSADVLVVAGFVILFSSFGLLAESTISFILAASVAATVSLFWVMCYANTRWFLLAAGKGASLFNPTLERHILGFFWANHQLISHFVKRGPLLNFLLLTVLMWGCYGTSMYVFTQSACSMNPLSCLFEMAEFLYFSPSSGPQQIFAMRQDSNLLPLATYMLLGFLPLLAVALYLMLRGNKNAVGLSRWFGGTPSMKLNIFLQPADELAFLQAFSRAEDPAPLLESYKLNQDIVVLKNLSGGSAATTLLAQQGNEAFYRKYAIGAEAFKLSRQHAWMETHRRHLPLASLLRHTSSKGFFSYDMPFDPTCYGLFDYIHTHSVEASWNILQTIQNDLAENLHAPTRHKLSHHQAEAYLTQKLLGPLAKALEINPALAELAAQPEIIVNGAPVRAASHLLKNLDIPHLAKHLNLNQGATVHGDLTVENIVYNPNHPRGYYLIDPLTDNLFESKYLDAAQLLQSLESGYEFMTRLNRVSVNGPRIDYPLPVSAQYDALCKRLTRDLLRRHGESGWWEIQLHHAVKMARILPYRCHHQPLAVPAYYAIFSRLLDRLLQQE